jgi:hypothetical protein
LPEKLPREKINSVVNDKFLRPINAKRGSRFLKSAPSFTYPLTYDEAFNVF